MRLSCRAGDEQRQHHADQRQRQRQHDRQRIEERAELHHQDQVHQQDRDAERREDPAEHLLLVLGLAALRDAYARRQRASPSSCALMSFDHLAERPALRVRLHRDDALAVEVIDPRRADALRGSSRPGRAAPCSARRRALAPSSGSVARSAALRARLGREPHRDVARLARRVDPVAGVDAGERRAQRLRDLPDGHAERAGERRGRAPPRAPASARASTGRRRPRPAPSAPAPAPGRRASAARASRGPCSWSWICF